MRALDSRTASLGDHRTVQPVCDARTETCSKESSHLQVSDCSNAIEAGMEGRWKLLETKNDRQDHVHGDTSVCTLYGAAWRRPCVGMGMCMQTGGDGKVKDTVVNASATSHTAQSLVDHQIVWR